MASDEIAELKKQVASLVDAVKTLEAKDAETLRKNSQLERELSDLRRKMMELEYKQLQQKP